MCDHLQDLGNTDHVKGVPDIDLLIGTGEI